MRLPKVEYRDVPGFPGYRVGDDGSVWSNLMKCRGGWYILKANTNGKYGHLWVTLRRDNKSFKKYVHTLVLETFVGPRPTGCEGRHFPDHTPSNNSLQNLRWGTPKENAADRIAQDRHGKKLLSTDVARIRQRVRDGEFYESVAETFGISPSSVGVICRGRVWKHLGGASPALRVRRGESKSQAKLTDDAVRFIRANYKRYDKTFSAKLLGAKYGVSDSLISEIAHGNRWRHVA